MADAGSTHEEKDPGAMEGPAGQGGGSQTQPAHHSRRALALVSGQLRKRALTLLGYLAVAYLIIRVLPTLEHSFESLERVRWEWVVVAVLIEILSEIGFVLSWRAIVDPEDVLSREGRGERMADRVAWLQLGGGMLIPGGSFSSIGVGAWILHRFGMSNELIAERQFNLQFLNTAVDALALIVFGLGLAFGIFPGDYSLVLTLLPALLAAAALAAALLIAARELHRADRVRSAHPKFAEAIKAIGCAVEDTRHLLTHRDGLRAALGAVAYLGFDVLVLWSAFTAIGAHPVPTFAVVVMAYIIGAIGGSLPLPAGVGSIGGMVAMFIAYKVGHEAAVAAVILYQAIGQLVPLIGGAIAYLFLRGKLGPIQPVAAEASG